MEPEAPRPGVGLRREKHLGERLLPPLPADLESLEDRAVVVPGAPEAFVVVRAVDGLRLRRWPGPVHRAVPDELGFALVWGEKAARVTGPGLIGSAG